mmetsp:Transcript_3390/g.9925  ORF Transcript_3390/g.9925 Transcript_3390/m.9925 type:complete len:219 (+) Transcript_3390:1324-1980(+)
MLILQKTTHRLCNLVPQTHLVRHRGTPQVQDAILHSQLLPQLLLLLFVLAQRKRQGLGDDVKHLNVCRRHLDAPRLHLGVGVFPLPHSPRDRHHPLVTEPLTDTRHVIARVISNYDLHNTRVVSDVKEEQATHVPVTVDPAVDRVRLPRRRGRQRPAVCGTRRPVEERMCHELQARRGQVKGLLHGRRRGAGGEFGKRRAGHQCVRHGDIQQRRQRPM